MSYMFEVYYKAPVDSGKESRLAEIVSHMGGALTYREAPPATGSESVCLTFEFTEFASAQSAAVSLRNRGEHVEGPVDYGN